MTISNGSPILPADVNGIWTTALATLRGRSTVSNPYYQWTETLHVDNITNATVDYLRTIRYVPRVPTIVRGMRIYVHSAIGGLSATATINPITSAAGGSNITQPIVASATSSVAAALGSSGSSQSIPSNTLISLLAGDLVNIVITTPTATPVSVTVSLLLEARMSGV